MTPRPRSEGVARSLEDYLRLVVPHVDPRLVAPSLCSGITKVARLLPAAPLFGFECRLHEEGGRTDFGVGLLPSDGSCEAFLAAPGVLVESPAWRAILALCSAWRSPSTPWRDQVANAALEFDMESYDAEVPVPSFLFQFEPASRQWMEVIDAAFEHLLGRRPPPPLRRMIELSFEALPPGAGLYGIGIMLSREVEALRLAFSGAPAPRWLEVLDRVGWRGPMSTLTDTLAALDGRVSRVALNLDVVGGALGARAGFELSVAENAGWAPLLDALVTRGHCTPGQREASLAWTGHVHERKAGDVWPEDLRRRSREASGEAISVLTRRISHVKIACAEGRGLEAKIYLAARYAWLRFDPQRARYVLDGGTLPTGIVPR